MPKSLTIPKNFEYPAVMDWARLRKEGIRHIERLASSIWTDYNTHDPGITILEVLCYAITDLGYRSRFDDVDLFSAEGGNPFFTAEQVLPNGPITALDFRKLIIDIEGVRNAWVEAQETPDVWFSLAKPATKFEESVIKPYFDLFDEGVPVIDWEVIGKIIDYFFF